jgi:xanthine dehydrogenase YagS FAD-binding subunit
LTTLAEIETSALVRERYPMLAEAAVAATPQLRNMATVGGNLLQRPRCWYFRNHRFHCWLKGGDTCRACEGENQLHAIFDDGPCVAVHPSDLAPALLALDAEVRLRRDQGERVLPLAGFLRPPADQRRTESVLEPDELLVAIRVPPPRAGARHLSQGDGPRRVGVCAGERGRRRANGGAAGGRRSAGTGGVASVPYRATEAEALLRGAEVHDGLFACAAQAALAPARPLPGNAYKIPLANALIRRALASLTTV